ncbi:DEAD/DEAH box helicase [Bifidobacterium callitrichidarum]|uniref:DEAD/DEAH box helicase n=1 Tax=Bifidobacterium callitrichidarum TaxID=2052941 RepID=UPI001F4E2EBC|nr:DEAD/DEAH box helicase [Bifidobacterium callitrichidarum]
MYESLRLFAEPTRAWFERAFGEPTEAQAQAWPAIRSGSNVLVIAPTGSGKTLAAFLSAIDRLLAAPHSARGRKGVRVLYISPLKALAVDVAKNLERPLAGIAAQCEVRGLSVPNIAIATRSGDTTAQERRHIASHPPDILVTTPESLYLLLTSKAGRILSTVDTVIVDEIHAVAGTKRGAHLALSLERLEELIAEDHRKVSSDRGADVDAVAFRLQRIGLSATVNPPEEAARFLGGGRPVTIVNPGGHPAMDLRMVEPLENMRDLQSVNVRQRAGGVDAESRAMPHISGVTPAMQRLAERKGIVPADVRPDAGMAARSGLAGDSSPDDVDWSVRGNAGDVDSSAIVGARGGRTSGSIWPVVERSILDEILTHHTTLVFVNSRGVAEKLTARLNDMYAENRHGSASHGAGLGTGKDVVDGIGSGDALLAGGDGVGPGSPEGREGFSAHYDAVVGSTTMLVGSHEGDDVIAMAHHGSVSKDRRKMIEERLKRGELRCVVATSSLELGIDMGSVDLVIQIDTPLSVSSGLQRVGRADHQVGGVSHALFYPLTRMQIVTGAASLESMIAGDIEPLAVPRNPLDILAQQTVAAASMHNLDADEWYATVRRSAPFAELPRDMFDAVVGMMSGAYNTEDFSAFRPRLMWDRGEGVISARPGAQKIAVTSGGTIPDRGLYTVVLPEADAGKGQRRVGELDEEMVYESRVGDVITLGTSTWQIQEITRDRVVVTPAPGRTARLPFWHGEGAGRDYGFSRTIGRFLRETTAGLSVEGRFTATIEHRLRHDGLDDNAITNLARLLSEQQAVTGVVPDDRTLVVERTRDEDGGWRIVLLSPFGRRVHEPWAMAISRRLNTRYGFDGQAYAADDGIVIQLPDGEGHIPAADLFLFDPEDLKADVECQVGESVLFAARFRECAARSLFMPRSDPGRRVPLWQQRLRAAQLLQSARTARNFPLLLETARECLQAVYDMPALNEVMTRLETGTITVRDVETESPSPFAENILFGFVGAVMYQYDQPQAERSAQLLSLDPQVLERLLGTTDMAQVLDPDVIHEVERELGERTFWNELAADDVTGRVTRYAKTHGPFTAEQLIADLGINVTDAVRTLDTLAAQGELLHGHFIDAVEPADEQSAEQSAEQWLHKDVFRRIRSRSLAKARKAVKPVEPNAYQMFLLDRQGVGPVGGERYEGADGLMRVIEQLEGVALPAALWESAIFPARVRAYQPSLLDELLTSGDVIWGGSKAGATGALEAGEVAFHPADSVLVVGMDDRADGPASTSSQVRDGDRSARSRRRAGNTASDGRMSSTTMPEAILTALQSGGAFHARQLMDTAKRIWNETAEPDINPDTGEIIPQEWSEQQFRDALWSLVWQGKITNSSFAPVRSLAMAGQGSRRTTTVSRRRGRVAPIRRATTDTSLSGLWSLAAADISGAGYGADGVDATDTYADNESYGTGYDDAGMKHDGTGRNSSAAAQSARAQMQAQREAEHALAIVEVLLDRYGIIAQPLIDRENVPGGYSALYPVLKRMEEHGRLVRGMFVRGFGAAQFAERETVDALRHPLEHHGRSAVALSVLDPANLSGSAIAWPPVAPSATKPVRRTGALVVLGAQGPMMYAAVKSKHLTVFDHPSSGDMDEHLRKAGAELAYALKRDGTDSITFSDVNGEPLNARHPFARILHQAGFVPVPQGMRLY